jgi:hypothetical protein
MFGNPSLVTRIAIGKGIGFLVGLLGLVFLPYFLPEVGWLPRIGILLWYTTLGAIIGVFGVFTWHPVLKLPMPWWFRGPLMGAWMNFVLAFFAYDLMKAMLTSMFGPEGFFASPFWFALEGAIFGLIVGYFATRFGGEGKETVDTPD